MYLKLWYCKNSKMEMKCIDGLMRAYKICCRREGESTKETEQSTKEGEGDGYEHCQSCTSCITLDLFCSASCTSFVERC